MLEDFLNSSSFEQMAREYSAKYNNASILNKKEDCLREAKKDFEDICYLFCLIKNTFYGNKIRLKEVFNQIEDYILEVKNVNNNEINIKETLNKTTNKECTTIVINMLDRFVNFIKTDENLIEDKSIYEKLKNLYIRFFKIIKDFYNNI